MEEILMDPTNSIPTFHLWARSVIAVVSVCIAVAAFIYHWSKTRRHYDWQKKVQALSYSLSKNERMRVARVELTREFKLSSRKTPVPLDVFLEKFDEKDDLYPCARDLLGHWENMSLAIELEIVDEDVAFKMVAGMFITYAYQFQEFIQHRRSENKRAYEFYEKVVREWQDNEHLDENLRNMSINFG